MEAGIQHLGRGTAIGVDLMLAVVEPGQRSVEIAHRVREMSEALGIRRFGVVLNKSTTPEDLTWMETEFGAANVFSRIPFDARIAAADRAGTLLADNGQGECLEWFRAIQHTLEERLKA